MNYGNDEVYLYFFDDADEGFLVKSSNFLGAHASAADRMILSFYSTSNDGDDRDEVILNIKNGTHVQVLTAIGNAMINNRPGGGGIITIADNVSATDPGIYLTTDITACGNVSINQNT